MVHNVKKSTVLSLVLFIALLMSSCSSDNKGGHLETSVTKAQSSTVSESTATSTEATETTIETAKETIVETTVPEPVEEVHKPSSQKDISDIIETAIKEFTSVVSFDLSAMNLSKDKVAMTISNAYFDVLSKDPTLKYAYSVIPQYDSDTYIAVCQINYMPYKVGEIDSNNIPKDTYIISTYHDLITVTDQVVGEKSAQIAITDPNLDFDTMQMVLLSQCGYGYIVFTINDDATKLIANPSIGLTMEQCVERIESIKEGANWIISEIITEDMSDDDKVQAVYDYITSTVVYDPEYKNSASDVSIDSKTAYGAFENKIAICGGYSHAIYVLMSHLNIPCYNVTG